MATDLAKITNPHISPTLAFSANTMSSELTISDLHEPTAAGFRSRARQEWLWRRAFSKPTDTATMEHTDNEGEYTIMSDGKRTYILDSENGGTVHSLAPVDSGFFTRILTGIWPLTKMRLTDVEAAAVEGQVGEGTLGRYIWMNGTSSDNETKLQQALILQQVASTPHLWTSARHENPYWISLGNNIPGLVRMGSREMECRDGEIVFNGLTELPISKPDKIDDPLTVGLLSRQEDAWYHGQRARTVQDFEQKMIPVFLSQFAPEADTAPGKDGDDSDDEEGFQSAEE